MQGKEARALGLLEERGKEERENQAVWISAIFELPWFLFGSWGQSWSA